jgi:NAD(P)-dependent dehydrogenase (short-subunit alcohol dehydrogenase family)
MLLKDKVAVIYGAGGAIGGAVARAFAAEGASPFLTGRHMAPVEVVARAVGSAGGSAEAAEVDTLDEQAVDRHLQSVIDKAGPSISRSTQSASRMRRFWVCLWSSWMSSSSPCRSRPTRGRTS